MVNSFVVMPLLKNTLLYRDLAGQVNQALPSLKLDSTFTFYS